MTEEIWKTVPTFERYEVSNKEHIKTIASGKIREFKNVGCKLVSVRNNEGKEKTICFSRLVALAFIHNPDPNNLPCVLHINGKSNEPDNLEWGKNGDQHKYTIRPKRLNVVPIQRLDKKNNILQTYPNRASISKWVKDNYTTISTDFNIERNVRKVCNGNADTAYGYKWRYVFVAIKGEEWKRHPYEELHNYEFSNKGRCFNGTKLIVGGIKEGGYMYVIGHPLHILIAQTFILNPDNLPQVDHINENKSDNRVCNLRWITNKDNNKHSHDKKIYQYDGLTFIAEFESETVASQKTGVDQSSIGKCARGERKTAGGYRWRFTKLK